MSMLEQPPPAGFAGLLDCSCQRLVLFNLGIFSSWFFCFVMEHDAGEIYLAFTHLFAMLTALTSGSLQSLCATTLSVFALVFSTRAPPSAVVA